MSDTDQDLGTTNKKVSHLGGEICQPVVTRVVKQHRGLAYRYNPIYKVEVRGKEPTPQFCHSYHLGTIWQRGRFNHFNARKQKKKACFVG